ncbi:MAG: hypothetical protein C0426_14695, partial [Rhodobacter sp.]|nr:hypothetical protein [Rhodobacter sp.]
MRPFVLSCAIRARIDSGLWTHLSAMLLLQCSAVSRLDLRQPRNFRSLTSVKARARDWAMMDHYLQRETSMAYKSLLTVASSTEGVLGTFTAAAELAQTMDAHLDALALGVDRTQVGYSYVGSGAVIIAAAMERAEAEAREAEAALNAAIRAQTPTLRASVETVVTQLGALT